MFAQRSPLIAQLEAARNSKVIIYVTGDRPDVGIQINWDAYDHFVNHLDKIGVVKKISLFLYTRGGSTSAARGLVHLVQQFCDELEVIVPSRAHSAGTLMALGASQIVMTKQATLGPIDPSVNTPLNPAIAGITQKYPVGVEAIKGYLELAKQEVGIRNQAELGHVFSSLVTSVHPLVLGEVYRARSQIKMLAKQLLNKHIKDAEKVKRIINFLCSESGSHDYTIHRREAKDVLGLAVLKPDDALYKLIKQLFDDIEAELVLAIPFDPNIILGNKASVNYSLVRGLLESTAGGSTRFLSEGSLSRQNVNTPNGPQQQLHDQPSFSGWKHFP